MAKSKKRARSKAAPRRKTAVRKRAAPKKRVRKKVAKRLKESAHLVTLHEAPSVVVRGCDSKGECIAAYNKVAGIVETEHTYNVVELLADRLVRLKLSDAGVVLGSAKVGTLEDEE